MFRKAYKSCVPAVTMNPSSANMISNDRRGLSCHQGMFLQSVARVVMWELCFSES